MDRKLLLSSLLLGLLALCSVATWWLSSTEAPALARATDSWAGSTDAAAADATATGESEVRPGAATDTTRAPVAGSFHTQPPFPDDATWVAIRVVDGATREPVAGAEVGWFSEALEQLSDERSRYEPDRLYLWRSPELQVERAGWRTTADQDGNARVTYVRWTTVIASSEGRYGRLHLPENALAPPGGYVLELHPDLSLAVQVVDDRGEPAPGVPVAVGVYEPTGRLLHFWDWGPATATSAPDGRATLRHLQQLETEDDTADPASATRWRVRTHLPGHDDAGVPFSLQALPADPIVLRLPACGRVRVRAEIGGKPVPGFYGAHLSVHFDRNGGWRPERIVASAPVGSDGWVRFAHVPLGREFQAASTCSGRLVTRFVGPVAPGQEVTAVIAPTAQCILLRGRLLEAEDRPIRDCAFQIEASGPELRCTAAVRTDDAGNFLVALGDAHDDNTVDVLRFVCHRQGQRPLRRDLPPRTLRPGVENLGDLVLSGGPLVVAGTFVDADGPHRKDLSFWVQTFDAAATDPDEAWQSADNVLTHQDGTGRFEVRGNLPAGRQRLVFATHEMLPMEPVEFRLGQDDLEVRVATGHPLTATLLPPKGASQEGIYAVLQCDSNATRDSADSDRLRVDAWRDDGDRLYLQWPALPDGTYTLSVHLWTSRQPVHVVPAIRVPTAAGGDPRLADIDLREALRTVTLNLFAADGSPLTEVDGVAFAVDQEPTQTWSGTQIWGAPARVLVPAGAPAELLLAISDYQPRRVVAPGDRLDVRLEPWPTIEVVVADVPELPPDVTVRARLETATPDEAQYRAQWSSGTRGEYFDAPADDVALTDGRAILPVAQGLHRIELHLVDEDRWIPLEGIEPATVLPNSGRVRVTVPAAQWAKALKAREEQAAQQVENR